MPYTFTTLAGSGFQPQGSTDGASSAASFNLPLGVAVDSSGNVYVADTSNHKIRKITAAGVVTTLAGSGSEGSADGTGSAASFGRPSGVTVDASGNVYVADTSQQKIRKISPGGVVTTLAGSLNEGSDNGTGSAASFRNPRDVAVDSSGNVYVADLDNHKIRKITAVGVVTTLAGSGSLGSADGIGSAASFSSPSGVAVDSIGNVYVADSYHSKIRKITAAGVVTTLAGSGSRGSADGTGSAASFSSPLDVAVDSNGNVYVADTGNHKIRKITAGGVVSTFTGSGLSGSANGAGNSASFYSPNGVAADSSGNIYVADTKNNLIRKVTTAGVVDAFAGVNSSLDGIGNAANFHFPHGVAVDSSGNTYVADTFNHKIRKITAAGLVTTLAGSGGIEGSTNGIGSAARFNFPRGLAVDGSGIVYVADTGNHVIRKITASGLVTTLAGSAGSQGSADGTGSAASLSFPYGVAVDSNGNAYVAEIYSNLIRKITAAGVVTTFAGSAGMTGSADGTGNAARFNNPESVAVDSSGNVYVADTGNNRIRKITPARVATTLAGSGSTGSTDGTGNSARFDSPSGVAVDSSGNVYVADRGNNMIRRVTAAGLVTTLAGSAGVVGNTDGTGSVASFSLPSGVAVDSIGKIYAADTYNHKIRKGIVLLTQTLSFSALSAKTFGDTPFTVSAPASSGLPVSFSIVSGPATISVNSITLTGPGTVVVRASQAGNTSYAAAPDVNQSFVVAASSTPMGQLASWTTAAGLAGADPLPNAIPFNDGVPNLLKYAFNMNASRPDVSVLGTGGTSGLPQIAVDSSGAEPVLTVEFLRRKESGLIYTPQRSDLLGSFVPMTAAQIVTSINSQWERVVVKEPVPPVSAPHAFARVQVRLP